MTPHGSSWNADSAVHMCSGKAAISANVDVAIVGGGITGLLTAYYLSTSGKRVIVCEKNKIGSGETSHTTAFLTELPDTSVCEMRHYCSARVIREVWQAGQRAIDDIERIVRKEDIECEFMRCDLYIVAKRLKDAHALSAEYVAQRKVGLATDHGASNIGIANHGYIKLQDQAKFHPLKFLEGLTEVLRDRGVEIYRANIVKIHKKHPIVLESDDGHVIHAKHVVLATHNPIITDLAVHTRVRPMQTYVIEASVEHGQIPEALYVDMQDPYHYIRVDASEKRDRIIVGGEDHPSGKVKNREGAFNRLRTYLDHSIHGVKYTVERQWSGQVIETIDGLPFIGWSTINRHIFICTGYAGNGMTFSAVAASMADAAIRHQKHPLAKLFSLNRMRRVFAYVAHNINVSQKLVSGRLRAYRNRRASRRTLESIGQHIPQGMGKVIRYRHQYVALYRDEKDEVYARSAVCTHMGCIVQWNTVEKTWDCPCHGSRFDTEGKVIAGPARTPLSPLNS